MKCHNCHITMEKDVYSRTATCPCCGRTVHYRTPSEKKRDRAENESSSSGCAGCFLALGCIPVIIASLLLLWLLGLIFGDGLFSIIGELISMVFEIVWELFKITAEIVWTIISGIFDAFF